MQLALYLSSIVLDEYNGSSLLLARISHTQPIENLSQGAQTAYGARRVLSKFLITQRHFCLTFLDLRHEGWCALLIMGSLP